MSCNTFNRNFVMFKIHKKNLKSFKILKKKISYIVLKKDTDEI